VSETLLSIGELAQRSGVAPSALRFYEERNLIRSTRPPGGQRRFHRETLRRVAFIRAAQTIGLTLEDIASALATLPDGRTPGKQDWERLSRSWQPLLQQRIDALIALRDQLTSCIGCGCLSLQKCRLYNAGDAAGGSGAGPRYLMGDRPLVAMETATKKRSAV
jgi:MerR family redox-sensitive transcriptional activator SoxR